MGCFAGPEIPSDGLVLALDGANFKSFKGEATTNELLDITWVGDGGGTGTLVTDNNLRYNGYPTYYYTPGSSINSYLNGADVDAARTSTVWTFSCYVKREDSAPITYLGVYMYYPSSDGYDSGSIQDVGNGWYRISRTRTGTSSYISLCGFTGFIGFYFGIKYYLSGAQLEKKSYTTTYVSTNTTRGTTVATGGGWADLMGNGNNGELVNGVRESSANGGSLVFDGTDDYISLTRNDFNTSLPNFTISALFYKTADGIILGNHYHGSTWESIWFSTTEFTVNAANNNTTNRQTLSYTTSSNSWMNLVAVNNSSQNYMKVFLNGAELATKTATVVPWNSSIIPTIGAQLYAGTNAPTGPISANIAQVSIYNRALSAAEIQQNFNATRSRYGL